MRIGLMVIFAALNTVGFAARVAAEDPPAIGVTMGYPASIGIVWHVSPRIAVRPEVSAQQITSTSTSVITTGFVVNGIPVSEMTTTTQASNDQWNTAYGASGLFYLRQWDALRTYLSPRFLYSRSTSSSTTSTTAGTTATTNEFTSNSYFVSGSFGAEYALARRFAVYGEVGIGYTHQSTDNSFLAAGNNTGHTVSTRSGVGAIFYF